MRALPSFLLEDTLKRWYVEFRRPGVENVCDTYIWAETELDAEAKIKERFKLTKCYDFHVFEETE